MLVTSYSFIGYTFSFPCTQETVKCARLQTWTQTFHCPDGVGDDHGALLQQALKKAVSLNIW